MQLVFTQYGEKQGGMTVTGKGKNSKKSPNQKNIDYLIPSRC